MALSRRTGRSRLTLALLVLSSLAVLTLSFRDSPVISGARGAASTVFSPLRGAAETVTSPFSNAWSGVTDYDDLEAENARLREELDELRGDEVRGAAVVAQYEELLAQNGLTWVGDIATAKARVIAGPASNFSHEIEIDKGSDDGLKLGMPVVNGAGLVGQLVQVTGGRSTVQLITDPDFAVGVRLVTDSTRGTARGAGEGEDVVVDSSLEAEAVVEKGTELVTAGTDGSAFPADIPLGTVRRTREGSGGFTLDLVVTPYADTERLSFVTVLLYEGEA